MSRYAIACRELEGTARGVGRWLAEVLRAIETLGRADDVTLYVERGLDPALQLGAFRIRATGPGRFAGATAWEQFALARALRTDAPRALLGPAYSLPLRCPCPAVVALHDLSFEAHPEWFHWREGLRRRTLARAAARRAHSILVLSRFGQQEVATRYGIPEARIRIIGAGVSARFAPVTDPARLAAAARAVGDGEIVLSVGSLFTRRRPAELIGAMQRVLGERPTARLVIIGDDRSWPPLGIARLLREAQIEHRTTWLQHIEEDLLIALYSLARVVVYLSDYEGFGLPPLEASACGTPVIGSARTASIETLTGHATLLDEVSATSVAGAILTQLAASTEPRVRPGWLDVHSWQQTAARVLAALDEAVA